jgi:uncharacterized protein (DUF2147 family)
MIWRAAALCAMSIAGCNSVMAQDRSPDGVWMRDDGNARVRIAPCGSKICATNLWIKDTRNGEEVGDRLIMTLRRSSGTKLAGTAYDPKRDRSYAITLSVGANGLTTRGCIIGGLLCRDVSWAPDPLTSSQGSVNGK